MHIFFSGIGGTAIGPLALIAKQAGYQVSGSDKQNSTYIDYLKKKGIKDITIGQSYEDIENSHNKQAIDWYVYSSAVAMENPDADEFKFTKQMHIKSTKRDDLLNQIINDKKLKMIAIAGTHGKTTTTAMIIWLFKSLGIPISYSVGAKINFGEMGQFIQGSEYFVYEADEFDRNFLAFEPNMSVITGVSWDHHEVFPTRDDYKDAFREFIDSSAHTIVWGEDFNYLDLPNRDNITVLRTNDPKISQIKLKGLYNRLDGYLAIDCLSKITHKPIDELLEMMNKFPGSSRRMEEIASNLYSDYAHTPEKIKGAMSVAKELAEEKGKKLIIVYEPLTNRRQHFMIDEYRDCFNGADKLYWVPSYLAREDPKQSILTPDELIQHLDNPSLAQSMNLDQELKDAIKQHLDNNDMVVCLTGGGGKSLDEWLRDNFS
ncbi:MAG: Mur ligase domain-containing protein [bacterium]